MPYKNPADRARRDRQYRLLNLDRIRAQQRTYRQANATTIRLTKRNGARRTKYGLTPEGWDWMLEQQGGACATCDRDATDGDHDHKTGLTRALLCRRCNQRLGHLERDPELTRRLTNYAAAHA